MTARADLDLVVIGTGSAGATIARACRGAGWEVAIVDSGPYGGTCALRGCNPKKVLVTAADAVDRVRRLEGRGVTGGAGLDWPALVAFERTFVDDFPETRESDLAGRGIRTLHGRARFTSPRSLEVDGEALEPRYVAIASGARPVELAFPGAELLTTSDEFLFRERLPERIAFVGGGFISFEFAHVATRAGARTTIFEAAPRVLAPFDPDLVRRLVVCSEESGIGVRTGAEVRGIEPRGDALTLRVGQGEREEELAFDMVVHGAGRVPDIDDLDLEAAGVQRTKEGVEVNAYLQSVSNPGVYAAGDAAAAGPPLTPVAAMHGRVVAANLTGGNHTRADHSGIPAVAFTIPPIASVGLLEEEARERGLEVEVVEADASGWTSTRRSGAPVAAHRVLVEPGSRRILGAHLLGPGADEVVNLFALAIRQGLTADDLRDVRLAYPTHGSDIASMVE